ncbi:uncharacterized protein [Neodiprion pinetum]|uniref:uncharacterized protein n=1 Tax=Neodiprion pinetum TaxID=441929 RepID=UPI00371FEDED
MENAHDLLGELHPQQENDDIFMHWIDVGMDKLQFLRDVSKRPRSSIEGNVKINLTLSCKFENIKHEGIAEEVKSFNTANIAILPASDIDGWFTHARADLLVKVEDFEQCDSGWSMIEILNTAVNISRYQPLGAGLSTFVELPKYIQRKKAVVNVKNRDERCLLWSITAARHPANASTDRTSHYRRCISELDCTDNAKSNNSVIVPIYLSDHLSTANFDTIHLPMVESNPKNDMARELTPRFHFAWIEDLSRLNKGTVPFVVYADLECILESIPIDEFLNHVSTRETHADYEHAKNVWEEFHLESLGDYSDLYLKTDVLLLAEIFENFRASCFKTYDLDPLHYYTAPGLAFDAMLKHTNVTLQLLDNPEMVLFIERAIRGGVVQCSNRHAGANNRFMEKDFDPNKAESNLTYFDVNNLYGAAMSAHLPVGSFEWEYQHIDITNHPDDSPIGYFLEVDLDYPAELHEDYKDLPLCPEHFTPPGGKNAKLATDLHPKTKYILHYRNLKQCLSLGLKVTKVHRVLKFAQSPWLEPYITLNTDMRKRSRNEFEKNFYKLMNNAVFGKTMENVRNHEDVKLVTKWEGRGGVRALIARPNLYSCTVFGADMVIIEMNRVKVRFAKPIYVGASILDLSKIIPHDFHYNYVKSNFSNSEVKLLYTDTDSLIYQFNVSNIYDIIKRDVDTMFDTSDHPPDNVYGIPLRNKKRLGLIKDENNGKIMTEFVGLRAKLYSFTTMGGDGEKVSKRAKGVKNSSINSITFDDYKRCLMAYQELTLPQCLIRSTKHEVSTIVQKKLALSWQDDKRQLIPGQTDTLPWGFTPAPQ